MDTKSRNIRYAAWIKLLAALLCLSGPLVAAWQLRDGLSGRNVDTAGIYWLAGGIVAFLVGMIWLVYAAGRRPGSDEVYLLPVDGIFLDIGLVILGIVLFFLMAGFVLLHNIYAERRVGSFPVSVYVLAALLILCASGMLMWYFTSISRRIKRGEALKYTLMFRILHWLYSFFCGARGAGSLIRKTVLLFIAYVAASSLMFLAFIEVSTQHVPEITSVAFMLFLAVNVVALAYILNKVTALRSLLDDIGKVRSGNLAHRVRGTGGEPFGELAASINGIAEGLGAAVESQVKAERMKAELITNVSHDLRTPLTSIITYIDLLKTEGPGSENAAGYICVLDAKARRLKALTEDLFEAAKAASGSIKPNPERLDAGELIAQGLGELGDRIRESGLDFRFTPPERQLFVTADGKLLWRVMENLFSNVFKYALPGSRVYVSALSLGGKVVISVKNISAAELNMPAEALMERFTRGDASRHSEGSGLGLAIAKSLTEIQGGRFFVEIDGDLFKAGLDFPEA